MLVSPSQRSLGRPPGKPCAARNRIFVQPRRIFTNVQGLARTHEHGAVHLHGYQRVEKEAQQLKSRNMALQQELEEVKTHDAALKAINEAFIRVQRASPNLLRKTGKKIGGGCGTIESAQLQWNRVVVKYTELGFIPLEDAALEVGISMQLQHPHLARTLFWWLDTDDGCLKVHMVMERCATDLQTPILDRVYHDPSGKPYSLRTMVRLGREASEALLYLHEHRIIHNDIKPENILLDYPNPHTLKQSAKLTDFGLAKVLPDDTDVIVGPRRGTKEFAAPEIRRHRYTARYSKRSDVWAMGATLYEILTARCYCTLSMTTNRMIMHPLFPEVPGAPQELEDLLAAMVLEHANDRPTMEEVVRTLRKVEDQLMDEDEYFPSNFRYSEL